ncbi:MAG: type II secretion system F family protein [bacterium]
MPVFTYEGKSAGGKEVSGEVEADSIEQARQVLQTRRVADARVKKKPTEITIPFLSGSKKVPAQDVTQFARQFATMIDAGLPLVQCLNILGTQMENERLKEIIKDITRDVESGSTLSEAMAKHKSTFDSLFINMVAAGEIGGILDDVLLRIAEYKEKADALKRKIKGAMMYPVVVLTVAVGATATLLIVVIPNFVQMFESSGVPLPLPTKIVVGMSEFLQQYILLLIAGCTGIWFLFKRYYATDQGEQVVDNFKLNMPLLGDLVRKSSVARFSRTLGTLLRSGVSILEALDITAKTAGNRILQDALQEARSSIGGGETITDPLARAEVFPPMVIQMVNVGEQTGELDRMLEKVADYYEEEVDTAVDGLTSIIEPIIIVYLGVVIGGMVLAMYLPLFDMMKVVS